MCWDFWFLHALSPCRTVQRLAWVGQGAAGPFFEEAAGITGSNLVNPTVNTVATEVGRTVAGGTGNKFGFLFESFQRGNL